MSVFRFLQARPYWLYKVAGVLVVVAIMLTIANALAAQQGTIFYPLVKFSLPTSLLIFIISILALVTEFIRRLIGKLSPSRLIHVGFSMLIIATAFGSIAYVEHTVHDRAHVASVAYGEHIYYLAKEDTGYWFAGMSTYQSHTLYECDRLGLICRALHKNLVEVAGLYGTIEDPKYNHPTTIELAVDAETNVIAILVNGWVAYTYAL